MLRVLYPKSIKLLISAFISNNDDDKTTSKVTPQNEELKPAPFARSAIALPTDDSV